MSDVPVAETADPEITPLKVTLSTSTKVNFASAQNGVSILKSLSLRNTGDIEYESLTVLLESIPAVIKPKTWNLDRLAPGDECSLTDLDMPLNDALLAGLNEAEFGTLTLTVRSGEDVIFQNDRRIELLARDEWGGIDDMAHLLAAHVSPNDSVVAAILKEAGQLLEASEQSGALDGYLSRDPGRVWMLAGAIWSATTALGLNYAYPPASFEQHGQKIRDPGRIRSEGLATCLDTSLLMAATFEAAGLNPVVLFSKDHAWVGLWLTERDFGSITEPDVMTVRKAIDAREFVALETTLLTKRPTIGMEAAAVAGREHTAERNEHAFYLAIDIRRARAARIRPLAAHRSNANDAAEESPAIPADLPRPLDFDFLPGDLVDEAPATAEDRISRWQRKLLDLSLRNRLLNFRDTRQTLPFLCPDVSALEDQLASGRKFKALALKDENPVGQRDLSSDERATLLEEVARDAFARGQIAVPLTGEETGKRLLELNRRSKSDMREGGTNTLFLAAGFLRWKKSEHDGRSYRAPLLLIPVKISRRSAKSDFVIEHHEDDVRFNATLLEFLKRDFDLRIPELEGDLPKDESGYDLPLIFEIMRRRVRDVSGFEVVEELAMSTFSFAKFLMWKDLVDRTDSLRESALVKHLVDNPTEPFLPEGAAGLPDAAEVDRRIRPRDLFTLLPADSSQLSAVLAAQDGHDFVLIGPPGTGKSQTIANIISQCLAVRKTVLFVAEKSAALDVVHRRLSAHGLADAVLELHSNKADRKSVVEQLGRSWDRQGRASTSDWTQVTDELSITRAQLNDYVLALHRRGTQGFSVFQAVGNAAHAEMPFRLSFDNKDAHDAETYGHLKRLSEAVGRCYQIVSDRPALPLIQATDWSFGWQAELIERTEQLRDTTSNLMDAAARLATRCGLRPDADCRPEHLVGIKVLCDMSESVEDLTWALARPMGPLEADSKRLAGLLKAYRTARAALSASYPMDRLQTIPLDQLDADWRRAQTKIWPLSILAQSSVRKLLQTYATGGNADPTTDIAALSEARLIREQVEAITLTGCPAYDGIDTDEQRLKSWLENAKALTIQIERLSGEVEDHAAWDAATRALAGSDTTDLQPEIGTFRDRFSAWSSACHAFGESAGTDVCRYSLADLSAMLDATLTNRVFLEDWIRWTGTRRQACAAGLTPLVEAVEDGRLDRQAEDAFTAAYAAWWLPLAMDAEPQLRRFSHWSHEDAIARFRKLDDQATEMAAEQVMRRIRHGLPARDSVARKSELGTLRHQLGLKKPSLPIRALIAEMPESFTKLVPCVLMSPLSVAQYLPPGQATFDVVIFDEASQITTWDAIGAIARGRQAIIVGDPKQLPPTNFFGRTDDPEDDLPESERDLESILDEVAAAGIPTLQLDWHYRSHDESLVAFSNWHYYGGRLVTFPSPETASQAVQLHQIDGTYARGQGRTNEDEARAITRMAVSRMKAWLDLPEEDRLTLGVITFNSEQKDLILDLLDEERRRDPDLEWFFDEALEEDLIVKNLENIQGDERDVMLFSITFGPDSEGKLSMAFGALNSDGGERRLNVAVTRARRELHVFASIRADQIDLSRTRALGVKHLKGFLDFAARGPVALPAPDNSISGLSETSFEAVIKSAIEARGWELRPQIGVSGFRIDLGVVHPDHAGVYLAGIECDGEAYRNSATARDRDKVRQAVLENLGWTILRVWSADWVKNPSGVVDRIDDALSGRLASDRAARMAAEAARQAGLADDEAVDDCTPEPASTDQQLPDDSAQADSAAGPPGPEIGLGAADAGQEPAFEDAPPQPDPERFHEAAYLPVLEHLIADIVAVQGPLPVALLGRRVAALHGWQRTGRRIADRVRAALSRVEIHDEDGVDFAWPQASYAKRIAFRTDLDRSVRDISRSEIAGLYDAHADALADSADPVLDLARLAGITRLSADARAYFDRCLDWRRDNTPGQNSDI